MKDIEIKNLYKKYHDFELNNINITVERGKVVGLIGENGSGKTTIIKSLLNLISKDKGSIKIFNKDYCKLTTLDKEQIGVVLDDSFFSNQLMIDDLEMVFSSFYSNWDSKLFYKYVKDFKLPLNKIVKDFSSGMKMKLKLICALSHHPKLLILDEPTNGLDPVFRYEILDLLSNLVINDKVSILISSHITTDLEHIADEIIFINNGNILLNESKHDLFNNYKVVTCNIDEFKNINKNDYLKYLKYKDEYLLLVNDIDRIKKYKIKLRNDSLEELMLMFIKGVNHE